MRKEFLTFDMPSAQDIRGTCGIYTSKQLLQSHVLCAYMHCEHWGAFVAMKHEQIVFTIGSHIVLLNQLPTPLSLSSNLEIISASCAMVNCLAQIRCAMCWFLDTAVCTDKNIYLYFAKTSRTDDHTLHLVLHECVWQPEEGNVFRELLHKAVRCQI